MLKENQQVSGLRSPAPSRIGAGTRSAQPLFDRCTADLLRVVLHAADETERCVDGMLRSGLTAEAVCLDVLTPVARRLGVMWEEDSCSFVDVTVGVGRLQALTHNLGARFARADQPGSMGRILVGTCPGEQHAFGITMVAEFLRRHGWQVEVAAAFDDTAAFLVPLEHEWFDVVAISAANDRAEARCRRLVSQVRRRSRNRKLGIMCGGRLALHLQADFAARVGADGWATDAPGAVTLAADLTGKRASAPAPVSTELDTLDCAGPI